jgi:uncharacterized protein (TIGR02594 family)
MLATYAWLQKEEAPRILVEAIKLYGVKEVIGENDNPTILDWADEIGVGKLYQRDSVPWCGLFMGVVAKRAGKEVPANPLWARNWSKWGVPCLPELGCVLVFSRESGGHVGVYVGEDIECYHVLGGNQSDSVCITRIKKNRLLSARCAYRVKPANVRKIILSPTGIVSSNEK